MKTHRVLISMIVILSVTIHAGERLPNGIELPDVWPPVIKGPLTDEPMPVPYLHSPPDVIPVDLGRQLFVDDFLIEATTLRRVFHQPRFHPKSPVLRPERDWELEDGSARAAVFSGGVWYDSDRKQFLMWYYTVGRGTALATSNNGIDWHRPALDLEPGRNIVLRSVRDSATVWLDHTAPPGERLKLFEARYKKNAWGIALHVSADGRTWSDETAVSGPSWDRSTMFHNPFRDVWVASVRGHDNAKGEPTHRLRCYHEGKTPADALAWTQSSDEVARGNALPGDLQLWVGADRLDPRNPDPRFESIKPQLYNLDAFPYESLMIGLFTIWQGPDNASCKKLGVHKRNEVLVGFSRDGFHWDRPDRTPFLSVSSDEKDWNAGNVQSAGGGCLVVGDELWFYCSGRTMHPRSTMATGLAVMRRDGFASMDAPVGGGTLTTRPLQFSGGHLFVNTSTAEGKLRVEVLGKDGQVLSGFGREDCVPVVGDHTRAQMVWKGHADLSALRNQPVRLRFILERGSLWSFWISAGAAGQSGGYVAAGGPGFSGGRDVGTVRE